MITYNPKEWFSLIFLFHKSDTFRRLFWVMLAVALYSALIVYLEVEVLHNARSSGVLIYNLLGFVIALLLVFRTNTAYERWWEGRRQWGTLVNCSRNFAIKLLAFIPAEARDREEILRLIPRFSSALAAHLRDGKIEGFPKDVHQPNHIALEMYRLLNRLKQDGHIDETQFRMLDLEAAEFTDISGSCERIKKSPIPFSYSTFIKKFIFIYVMTMPFSFVEYGYAMIPVVVFVLYVLTSLELIAEEIEEPFGVDTNDLPIDEMVATIDRNIAELKGTIDHRP